jgi:hypothetical protein
MLTAPFGMALPARLKPRSSEVVIETLECVSDERQAHLGRLLGLSTLCHVPSLEEGGIVGLVDLVGREICGVNVGRQAGLEWRTDSSKAVKLDAMEETVCLELLSATTTQTVLSVANQAKKKLSVIRKPKHRFCVYILADQVLGFAA